MFQTMVSRTTRQQQQHKQQKPAHDAAQADITILGVPQYNCSIKGPKTLFLLQRVPKQRERVTKTFSVVAVESAMRA